MARNSPSTIATGPSLAEQRKWQARDDLRTMQAAQEVASDPKRLAAAKREAQSQITALAKVAKKTK